MAAGCVRVPPVTDAAPSARPRLTFFFPAYNEQENVERTVELALSQIGPLVPSIEVLSLIHI